MIVIPFSSAKVLSATCMAAGFVPRTSRRPNTVTVVPARSRPSMPLSAPLPAPAPAPRRPGAARGFGAGGFGARGGGVRESLCPCRRWRRSRRRALRRSPAVRTATSPVSVNACVPPCLRRRLAADSHSGCQPERSGPATMPDLGDGSSGSGGTCQTPRHLDLAPGARRQGERVEVAHPHRPGELVGGEASPAPPSTSTGPGRTTSPGRRRRPRPTPVDTTSWTCITCAHDSAKSSHGWAAA